jgi:ligand-binding sensor domain-containing protein
VTTLLGFRTAVVTGLAALAAALPLIAERLPVRTVTTADGLPRDQLQCVRSDQRGFVWFCTAEGLVRFDGQSAVTFGRDGLARIDPVTGAARVFGSPDGFQDNLPPAQLSTRCQAPG